MNESWNQMMRLTILIVYMKECDNIRNILLWSDS
jgi:hypothetical protein